MEERCAMDGKRGRRMVEGTRKEKRDIKEEELEKGKEKKEG